MSADPFTVGAVAGELLARFLPGGGEVAFFTGWLAMQDHAEKLRGFESSLRSSGGALALGPMVEAHDDEREGHRRALRCCADNPQLKGIYVSTVNSLPVLRAAEEAGRSSGLTVVTTDLFPELVEWIRAGKVAATVYQRPLNQGRLALQALYQFLLDGTRPASRLRVVPHMVMRSNLDQFLERCRSTQAFRDANSRLPAAKPRARGPRSTAGARAARSVDGQSPGCVLRRRSATWQTARLRVRLRGSLNVMLAPAGRRVERAAAPPAAAARTCSSPSGPVLSTSGKPAPARASAIAIRS